jgi:hypothetical protein
MVDFLNLALNKSEMFFLNAVSHAKEYAAKVPFLVPKDTIKIRINMYIGVKKKLTNQQPRTNNETKSSLNTWNNKNSFPINPAL